MKEQIESLADEIYVYLGGRAAPDCLAALSLVVQRLTHRYAEACDFTLEEHVVTAAAKINGLRFNSAEQLIVASALLDAAGGQMRPGSGGDSTVQ